MFLSIIDNHPYKTCDDDIMIFAKWHSREIVKKVTGNYEIRGMPAARGVMPADNNNFMSHPLHVS
eukprot:scaffold421370_cov82-Attheya_sp.AAC.2